jgi:hypothetical protein
VDPAVGRAHVLSLINSRGLASGAERKGAREGGKRKRRLKSSSEEEEEENARRCDRDRVLSSAGGARTQRRPYIIKESSPLGAAQP